MEKLFDDTLLVSKERPRDITKQQESKMYIDLAHEIIKDGYSEDDIETIINDLINVDLDNIGFEIAKDLERDGYAQYEFTSDFITWLDFANSKRREILNSNIKLWVLAHSPKPIFEKSSKLIINETLNYHLKKGDIIYITGINLDLANYVVAKNSDQQGGYLIEYDKLEKHCNIVK